MIMADDFVKVINSTYKLLDFFPDNDPLKYKAKEKALEVLGNLTVMGDVDGWTSLKKEKAGTELLDDIEVLKNYLKLGKHQGWVGGINYLILQKEFDEIKGTIKVPRGSVSHSLRIGLKAGLAKPFAPILQEKESQKVIPHQKEEKVKQKTDIIKEPLLLQPHLPKTEDELAKNAVRREKILHIINNMGRAQVSDIIKEIPQVTKRTIRRDIDELLKKSKIVRNGEWNKIFYQVG